MNDVPGRVDIHISPTDVRGLAEKVYAEVHENVVPRVDAILAKFGGGDEGRAFSGATVPIGSSGADYAGSVAGEKLMTNVEGIRDWTAALRESMVSFATGLAVIAEQSHETDSGNAVDVTTAFNGPAEFDPHGNPTRFNES